MPMISKGVRPLGRQKRPAWRGSGFPPVSHQQQNEDSGTPAIGSDDSEFLMLFENGSSMQFENGTDMQFEAPV